MRARSGSSRKPRGEAGGRTFSAAISKHAEGDGGKSALDHKWCRTKPPLSPFVCDDPRPEHDEALVGISR